MKIKNKHSYIFLDIFIYIKKTEKVSYKKLSNF